MCLTASLLKFEVHTNVFETELATMANFESEGSVHEKLTELERLVEIWKILGISHMNFESITDLITQQLVGLRALGDNEIRGTSMK